MVFICLIPALFLIPVALWCISFGFAAGYIGLLLLISGSVLGLRHKSAITALLLPIAWLIINGIMAFNTINTYDEKRARYFNKVTRNEDLDFFEKLNIYGLNIAMAMLAIPFYKEAALESLYLLLPSRHGTRSFRNGFFLESKKIQEVLSGGLLNETRRVTWSSDFYPDSHQNHG